MSFIKELSLGRHLLERASSTVRIATLFPFELSQCITVRTSGLGAIASIDVVERFADRFAEERL